MRSRAPIVALALFAAVLVAGCGGSGSGGSNSTAPSKKATAPNAPAGSKVVACQESVSEVTELRTTEVDCGTADRIARRWQKHRSCALAGGASRGSCSLGAFRCQTVRADAGVAVSCARPGGDVTFVVRKAGG